MAMSAPPSARALTLSEQAKTIVLRVGGPRRGILRNFRMPQAMGQIATVHSVPSVAARSSATCTGADPYQGRSAIPRDSITSDVSAVTSSAVVGGFVASTLLAEPGVLTESPVCLAIHSSIVRM